MKLFACTFRGWPTMYIEAANEEEVRQKALERAIEGNDLRMTEKLIVKEID